jgi:hypothetical protein
MNFDIAPKETEVELNWNDAVLYCFSLTIDGKTGWRLPNRIELLNIYKEENDFDYVFYLSSTKNETDKTWVIGFASGVNGYASNYDWYRVRAIRDI